MKKSLLILLFLLFINFCFAQLPAGNKNHDIRKLYMNPQNPPSYPGGEAAWQNFVATAKYTVSKANNANL
jgi:hypothetical protein